MKDKNSNIESVSNSYIEYPGFEDWPYKDSEGHPLPNPAELINGIPGGKEIDDFLNSED
jgi:hypothetical protein